MSAPARYERDGGLGIVTIDHPPLNLYDRDLILAVRDALGAAASDSPRALIVRAEGDVFSGGADVHVFQGLSEAQGGEFVAELLGLAHSVEDLPFPTLAVVNGLCLTAGFELSLACDMIWAAESAQFGLVEIVVGLTPLMGGTQRVAERAGPARARELVMTGGLYPAATMESWNVVNRVLPDADLADKALRFGHRLASGPTVANAATKRIIRAQVDEGTRGADARTAEYAAHLFETEDLRGAVEKFLSDGPGRATFEGR